MTSQYYKEDSSAHRRMKEGKTFVPKSTPTPKSPIKTSHTNSNTSINTHVKFLMLEEEMKQRSSVYPMLLLSTHQFRAIFSPDNSMSESERLNSDYTARGLSM